jgi:hypothetical protein
MKKTLLIILFSAYSMLAAFGQNNNFSNVIDSYLALKNALVEVNNAQAKASAGLLYTALSKIQPGLLNAAQRKVWTTYAEKLSKEAEPIRSSNNIEYQREQFVKISENLYKMLKEMKVNTSDIYYQFCPMAANNKGAYWLSETSAISNPYFGKKMLKCGMTKDTLKAKK